MIQSKIFSNFLIIVTILLTSLILISSIVSANYFENFNAKSITLDSEGLYEKPSVAVSGNFVHVVWDFWPDEFNCSIFYKRSIDNGKNWQEPIMLSSNESIAIYPVIAINKNIVHVAWKDYINDNPEIYYVNSYNDGESWNEVKRLTYNSSRKSNIFDVKINVDNSNVYLSWKDYRSGSSEVFFKKSFDNGETWFEDQRLTFDYNPSYYPDLTVENGKIFIAYEDRFTTYNIGLLESPDNGVTWKKNKTITNSDSISEKPNIVINDDVLYLIWQEDVSENKIIYFKKSKDNGNSWSDLIQLTPDDFISKNPKIYIFNENIFVIYQKNINRSHYIFYRLSRDFGESWGEETQLVTNNKCYTIDMCGESNNIHIVWQDFIEATLSNIWHLGNYNISAIPSENIGDEELKSPSLGIVFYIIAAIISFIIFKKKIKGEYI